MLDECGTEIGVGGGVRGTSSAEQRDGRHDSSELVMAAWPVVHWQFTSVTPQPEPGMAATRQATFVWLAEGDNWEPGRRTAQSGTAERSGV